MEIKVIPYSKEAVSIFATAMGDYSEDIVRAVRQKRAHIWNIGKTYYIVMVEQDSKGSVLVVLCSAGQDMNETAPRVLEQANNIGAYGVRFHAQRKGVAKLIGLPMQWVEEVFLVPTGGQYGK